ncbi:MAG: ABATE domain-containing protein, partial [Gemmatimonadetes bacterium]|nr:ABATE domain-containing protein [Gemmatimonadota bacterium]
MIRAGSLPLIGGHLALDFANTAGMHASDERSERLTDYAELLAWAKHAGTISAEEAEVLERESLRHPGRARRALAAAIELREAVYRVFAAIARQRPPAAADLTLLHEARVRALAAAQPAWSDAQGLSLRWPTAPPDLARPLHPVMIAAPELLASPDLRRLRQCERDPCGWLFIDRSRSGTRRWCSSSDCGNISRVRRFRARRAEGKG